MAERSKTSNDSMTHEEIWQAFNSVVNMSHTELKNWLGSDQSRMVGWTHDGESESVGHQSGHRIVAIKQKKKSDLTDHDYRQMRQVLGYVHRHMAQGGPAEDVEHSRWRYSLMNWGHDPMKGEPSTTTGTTMANELKKGDQVEWETSQGKTHGTVLKKQTSSTQIKTHKVAASKDDPQYIVESAKSGKKAAHKPEALKKKS